MSRQLAIVIAHLLQRDDESHAHLIAIDQETGKGVMLDLDSMHVWTWKPLLRVPVHLLGPIDCDTCGGGDAHAENCPSGDNSGGDSRKRCRARLMPSGGYTTDASLNVTTISRCMLRAGHEPSPHHFPTLSDAHLQRTLQSDIEEDRH